MRILFSAISVLLLLSVMAFAAEEKPRCEQCGMFFENSPTRIIASASTDGEEGELLFESLICVINYIKDVQGEGSETEFEVLGLEVLDYSTFGTDNPTMLDAKEAQYLYGTEPLRGSMAPFIAAFPDVKSALGAMDGLGGEAMEFKEVMQALMKAEAGGCGGGCAGCPKKDDCDEGSA